MWQWLSKSDLAAEVRHQQEGQGGNSATAGSQVIKPSFGAHSQSESFTMERAASDACMRLLGMPAA